MLELVVLGDLLRVAHHLEDHHVVAVGKDKGPLLSKRAVIGAVKEEGVLVDEFFFCLLEGESLKAPFFLKTGDYFRLHPDEIPLNRRRFYFKPGRSR